MTLDLGLAARLIAGIRANTPGAEPWSTEGVAKALRTTAGSPGSVLAAAALAAEDPTLRAPSEKALLVHWPKNATTERPTPRWTPCGEHPEQPASSCTHPSHQSDMTPEQIAAAAAECKRLAAEATAAARERRAHVEEARAGAPDTHQRRGGGPHPAERPAAACPTPNHDDQEAS
jgi:hypothetical protein